MVTNKHATGCNISFLNINTTDRNHTLLYRGNGSSSVYDCFTWFLSGLYDICYTSLSFSEDCEVSQYSVYINGTKPGNQYINSEKCHILFVSLKKVQLIRPMKVRFYNTHIIIYFVFHIDHLVIIVLSAVAFIIVLAIIVIVVVVVIVAIIRFKQKKKLTLPQEEGKQLLITFINEKLFNSANVTYQENSNEMVKPTTLLLKTTTVTPSSYGVTLK